MEKQVSISMDDVHLTGDLVIPPHAESLIVFSHGSGSSRKSPRNRMVAKYLQDEGLGTFLFDLLTPEEDEDVQTRFDIELLTNRLVGATQWLEAYSVAKSCRIGFFGASTGAASALRAAALLPQIFAVVSRGGRPDLAGELLKQVKAPTLLIVGAMDEGVLDLNREAYAKMTCEKKLVVVEGASHLFEEKGKMEEVAMLSAAWFIHHEMNADDNDENFSTSHSRRKNASGKVNFL